MIQIKESFYNKTDSFVVFTASFGCIAISDTEKDMILSQF